MQAANANAAPADTTDYVTVFVGETMFGLTIDRVHDVFVPAGITPVPLAPREIVGLLNLRGRVVTALCLRRRLSLPDRASGAAQMAIGLEQAGETFALIVDGVGEVLKLGAETHEPVPINLDPRWRDLSLGVHRLDGRLLVILDVDALLAFGDAQRDAKVA
ncbi:chemotaxis protein CheW [Methylobacterium sp. Leaf456]|uniref:chemotaxis protein CheW n=1 Tax=Methylobacterium sp. Leaf456 TaxID=1736382 RepID=UPI0006FB1A24|nr:chemotaxis protein CheW [Methylobacterium sp. Leaf456]KQT58618.1 chemotaxis protein CheW [Methylobacterium sp. Leaf456]